MCTAGSLATDIGPDYKVILGIQTVEKEIIPRYYISAFSFPEIYCIKQEDKSCLSTTHWGLIPSFVESWDEAKILKTKTINARSESVFEKASFKNSILSNRAVVLLSGFFEYQHIGKDKIPYYIRPIEDAFFMFGAITNDWRNPNNGELISTCSLVTTEANDLMSEIHNSKKRMPLLLNAEQAIHWLDKDLKTKDIQDLMQPLASSQMQAYPIDKKWLLPKNLDVMNLKIIEKHIPLSGSQTSLF